MGISRKICFMFVMSLLVISFTKSASVCINGWYYNGDAYYDKNLKAIVLTPDESNKRGSVWYEKPVDLTKDFVVEFKAYFGDKDYNGADGITFTLQNIGNGSLGGLGGGLGCYNILPSISVEFDTFSNSHYHDIYNDHIAIDINGCGDHLKNQEIFNVPKPIDLGNIEDGKEHDIIIKWNATSQLLTVIFDGKEILEWHNDLINNIFNGNNLVYMGFTGGTGDLSNLQYVKPINITINQKIVEINNHTIKIIKTINITKETKNITTKEVQINFTTETKVQKVVIEDLNKSGYLVEHEVDITNIITNITIKTDKETILRTIMNISKKVAYSTNDMILPKDVIIIQREPVIALDIKDPKEGEKITQQVIILSDAPESEIIKGIKIEHKIIVKDKGSTLTYIIVGTILVAGILAITTKKWWMNNENKSEESNEKSEE